MVCLSRLRYIFDQWHDHHTRNPFGWSWAILAASRLPCRALPRCDQRQGHFLGAIPRNPTWQSPRHFMSCHAPILWNHGPSFTHHRPCHISPTTQAINIGELLPYSPRHPTADFQQLGLQNYRTWNLGVRQISTSPHGHGSNMRSQWNPTTNGTWLIHICRGQ